MKYYQTLKVLFTEKVWKPLLTCYKTLDINYTLLLHLGSVTKLNETFIKLYSITTKKYLTSKYKKLFNSCAFL